LSLDVFRSQGPPSHDLAFETEMLERAAAGRPSVLVSSWPGPAVVLGYAQPADDVDLEWCRKRKMPVLRRLSGGTGVIHRGDLAVALSLPKEHPWAEGIVSLYDRFLDILQPALGDAGSRVERLVEPRRGSHVRSPICFEDQLADSLVVDGRKAVGCSQARRKGCVLIHAVILLGLDPELYSRVFRVDAARVREGLAPAVTGVAWEKVADLFLHRLAHELELDLAVAPRPAPSVELLAVYDEERWAPVPDGGMPSPTAGLV
jgi:lipoate-protein ligase A